jgi:hypothetical protein
MRASEQLVARAWVAGTDFPEPTELNWLYHLGLAVISILYILSFITIGLRLWARHMSKQIGVGKCLNRETSSSRSTA